MEGSLALLKSSSVSARNPLKFLHLGRVWMLHDCKHELVLLVCRISSQIMEFFTGVLA